MRTAVLRFSRSFLFRFLFALLLFCFFFIDSVALALPLSPSTNFFPASFTHPPNLKENSSASPISYNSWGYLFVEDKAFPAQSVDSALHALIYSF